MSATKKMLRAQAGGAQLVWATTLRNYRTGDPFAVTYDPRNRTDPQPWVVQDIGFPTRLSGEEVGVK